LLAMRRPADGFSCPAGTSSRRGAIWSESADDVSAGAPYDEGCHCC
jgi:hypothetical protein